MLYRIARGPIARRHALLRLFHAVNRPVSEHRIRVAVRRHRQLLLSSRQIQKPRLRLQLRENR
ncbi:MAG: hypothetical protein ACHP79_17575, partial [Terriglobales bacterium]